MLNWKNFKTGFLLVFALSALSACEVVDLDSAGKPIIPMTEEEKAALSNMEPKAIADKIWNDVFQEAQNTTTKLSDNLANDQSYFINLVGTIEQVDDKQNISLKVDDQIIVIQAGNIVRGNAIRDANSIIRFDQFKNQIQFARLSKELNKKAIGGITKPDGTWQGKNVEILTALTVKNGQIQDAVPLMINER
ncbi:DUF2291 family protein [Conservatibacter flavescens]|uniref:DUF2291 domain-containing protein n=1 Tax=Conservatibacter flavescens TaxID=28161 RepID=A0A2M8S2H3_9PAST|nr:DUF2291 family protein [Conservatibacter flavescens]PJG85327.1 hypothetical protein CVP05_06275 [Conservatibacter flavescens]